MKETYVKAEIEIVLLDDRDILDESNKTPFAPYSNENNDII